MPALGLYSMQTFYNVSSMKKFKTLTITIFASILCLGISTTVVEHAAAQSTQSATTASSYCGGKLGSVSRLGKVRGYSVYTPLTSTNGNPCIQIWDFRTGRVISKVYTTDPAHPDVNAFFACKVRGLVWAAKATRAGSTPASFVQSTKWGQMPAGPEAFNQVAACPAGFSPSRPI